jgi:V/A-type H+-transporting ATPase subunit I
MSRALVVGPREKLDATIDILHSMQLLHIVDHRGDDAILPIGKPLPQAAELSDSLVKLRSIASILAVEATAPTEPSLEVRELRERILVLELNITEEDAARKKIESLLGDLARRIDELRPFAALGLPLELYQGYETVAVLVGRANRAVDGFEAAFPNGELFQTEGAVAVFVPKSRADDALSFLSRFGFAQVEIPKGSGDPAKLLAAAEADESKWRERLKEVETRLEKLREKYASFVVAAEEALEVELEKAEAPLRFAASDHSFVVDGWVPASKFAEFSRKVSALGVHVEALGESHDHDESEPPVLLKNPKPARPLEFLIHLYSTPSYHELDPTVFIFIAFPFFFGFMVGDAGYGFFYLLVGVLAAIKMKKGDLRNLFVVIGMGGFWALLMGLFVFGEMFGIPFHLAPKAPPGELSWAAFGLNFPLEALLHRAFDVADMIYLSILFAALHLGVSFVFGFVNEVRHSKKHAIAKIGFLLALIGVFTILTNALAWTRVGGWVRHVPLGWFPWEPWPAASAFLGIQLPYASVGLLIAVVLGFGESPIAPLEIGGILANVMSYARLAGIAVGEGAIATAFTTLIIDNLILNHDIGTAIFGSVLLFIAQLLVFMLGGISAGIQGIRLNYVEAFIKFYKGNGTRFLPFGMRTPKEA